MVTAPAAPADFHLTADYQPTGDQPDAIDKLVEGLNRGDRYQTLLGVTGSGKTFTMANVIQRTGRPALVLAHNKTLAAQLCSELKEFFPQNAVEYFVSYYDYYQPEAYIPRTDTYIAKDADINEEIDKLRHAATRSLFTRRDVIIVASVSCIYGLGEPDQYAEFVLSFKKGQSFSRQDAIRKMVSMQYERNDMNVVRGKFRLRGDSLTILPSYDELAVRIDFFGDEVERIVELDPLTGEIVAEHEEMDIFPAKHFVTTSDRMQQAIAGIEKELAEQLEIFRSQGKILEAARLEERTHYDIESMRETGYCPGVENYSRHLQVREPGSTPWCLLDYFPDDWLVFVDESHNTLPQVQGQFFGDRARKETLVEFGFRLPSAMDNRPQTFEEFDRHINQAIFVSATPGDYEMKVSSQVVEQVIRPTGLLDPEIVIKPTKNQVDDLMDEIRRTVDKGQRILVTTLTKKMAEDLADYLKEMGIKTHYIHAEVETLDRVEILRDLRLGVYDVVVGINLLREGLDLPEVSLVCILDADKEGYLRSNRSLIQTIGRAARHIEGRVVMYADKVTQSMQNAIDETYRRRKIQEEYNREHGIEAASIVKQIRDITDHVRMVAEEKTPYDAGVPASMPKDELLRMVKELETQMKTAAKNLEFEKAAALRDKVVELRRELVGSDAEELAAFAEAAGRSGPLRFGRSQAGGRDRGRRYRR
ncbi:MAG: excinuclease ABC subunit UvrB [Dehalococcoidia bacterium]|nr:excinuclease ABC subunit UvrB [Dehalococcoidia bacterium]MBK9610568.1 excinuclease ABC subunit UvrB [Dehalococcoidia bacterium]MCC6266281.1 excinuclease ABC subunit UvrB [Dehalococcoidia bacterium]